MIVFHKDKLLTEIKKRFLLFLSPKLFLILIVFFSFCLRIYKIDKIPVALNWDEAAIGYNAYSILKTGRGEWGEKFPLTFRSFNDFKSPLLIYLTVPFIWLLGLNELAVRLPIVLIGSLTPVAAFFFTKLLFPDKKNKPIWFLASFFLAVEPWHIHFTRASFEASLSLFLVILGATFLLDFVKNKNNSLFFAAVFWILSLYAYHSAKIFIPLLVFSLIFVYKTALLKNLKKALIVTVFSFVLLLPLLITSFFNQGAQRARGTLIFFDQFVPAKNQYLFEMQKEAFLQAKSKNNLLLMILNRKPVFIFRQFVTNYFKHLDPRFLFFSSKLNNQRLFVSGISLFYPFEFLSIIIGLLVIYRLKGKKRQKLFLFFWLVLAILVPSLSMDVPHPLRGMFYLFILEMFSCVGLFKILTFIPHQRKLLGFNQKMNKGNVFSVRDENFPLEELRFKDRRVFIKTKISSKLIYLILAFFLLSFGYFTKIYLKDFPSKSAVDWQYGAKQLVQYVKEHKDKYTRVYIPDVYGQTYIFYLFYGQRLLGESEIAKHTELIDNIHFTNDIPAVFSLEEKTLLVKFEDEKIEEHKLRQKIYFPDGKPAFVIYEY